MEQDGNIEIVSKPDSIPQIADNAGIFFKEDGKPAGTDTNDVQMAVPVQPEAERDEHFRALETNTEKGLDRYAGFEEMIMKK